MGNFQSRWEVASKTMPMTIVLIGINFLLYLITAAQSRSLENNMRSTSLGNDWVMFGPAVDAGQWYRLLTSSFLHFGVGHLLMNMLLLLFLGANVERTVGSLTFLASYLVCALGSGVAVYAFSPNSFTAGASGAIYGLMAFLVVMAYHERLDVRAPLALLLVNIGYTFLLSGVSVAGHFGGMIIGLILAFPLVRGNQNVRILSLVTMVALLVCAVLWVHAG